VIIREATLADVPAVVAMGQRFFDASGYASITSYDHETSRVTFERLISNPDGVIFVADCDGELVGSAAALLFPFFFNANHKHGQEFFWWVDKDARGCGQELRIALEEWAENNGAQSFAVACLASMRPEAVARVYERAGYQLSDSTFVRAMSCQ